MSEPNNIAAKQDYTGVTMRIAAGMASFSPDEWGALSGTLRNTIDTPYNPFLSFNFLSALEDSGCVSPRTGWLAQHLRLESADGTLIGAIPCYLKNHSQGEYVFDHGWADAFERAGGHYYPKLQASIPFTPVSGPRLLTRAGINEAKTVQIALAEGLKTFNNRIGASSAHVTFAQDDDIAALMQAGFLRRTDKQFHFFNDNYDCYDDFLSSLASRKRKALKRERHEALAAGIKIDRLTGTDLNEAVWDAFFAFYMDTGKRKWGLPYLNRRFFSLIGERMADDILLVMARRDGRYIAGAINFIGSDALYGRNWGCIENHPFLHFEVCYHQAIDFAIEKSLKRVEAGAQGEHKLARGYLPVTTSSAHYIAHPGLRRAIGNFLEQERHDVEMIGDFLENHGPFKKS